MLEKLDFWVEEFWSGERRNANLNNHDTNMEIYQECQVELLNFDLQNENYTTNLQNLCIEANSN